MFGAILEKIFSGANFNRMMFVLAIVGITYFFTQEWPNWTILNAVIFCIAGYCLILIVEWFIKKIKQINSRNQENAQLKEAEKEWERNVISFFYSLSPYVKDCLLSAYNNMDKDKVFPNKRSSSDCNYIMMCRDLKYHLDSRLPKNGYYGQYFENCINFEDRNDVVSIIFDPIICRELEKLFSARAEDEKKMM